MKLQLRYHESMHAETGAVFIHGSNVSEWLREISRWSLPVEELECYIIPASLQSVEPGGLFVIFRNPLAIKQIDFQEPYHRIRPSLYIPIHTILIPEVADNEWNDLLIWEQQ